MYFTVPWALFSPITVIPVFTRLLAERGGLTHEPAHHLFVALAEHGGHDIPLRAEVEQGEEVPLLSDGLMDVRGVDVAELVDHRDP
jgi:hypothetical protein